MIVRIGDKIAGMFVSDPRTWTLFLFRLRREGLPCSLRSNLSGAGLFDRRLDLHP